MSKYNRPTYLYHILKISSLVKDLISIISWYIQHNVSDSSNLLEIECCVSTSVFITSCKALEMTQHKRWTHRHSWVCQDTCLQTFHNLTGYSCPWLEHMCLFCHIQIYWISTVRWAHFFNKTNVSCFFKLMARCVSDTFLHLPCF